MFEVLEELTLIYDTPGIIDRMINPLLIILDAASPTWEQLENAMVAVKTVVHGLVDFIQNYSRKGHETPQVTIFDHHCIVCLNVHSLKDATQKKLVHLKYLWPFLDDTVILF